MCFTLFMNNIAPQRKGTIMSTVFSGKHWRIMVLTDRLFRFEYSETGAFLDERTTTVFCRDFPDVSVEKEVSESGNMSFRTACIEISYDGGIFSSTGLSARSLESGAIWICSKNYGNPEGNYLGTTRTLDQTDGVIILENGLFSREGWSVLDDSDSQVLLENDEVTERPAEELDFYLFFYEKHFEAGLQAFCRLTGKAPMLPRYALSNWWSKYEKYTEDSYNALMDRFKEEKIPLSVAVIDMDWHITEVDSRYGTGWTGYTWNTAYFPDYRRFLKGLHERGLAVTLNLHPADGIRAFEAMYPKVAEMLGLDTEKEEPAAFDLTDPDFRKAYFDLVLGPYEKDGVDFWWIDWQQGTRMGKSHTDPLWLLNHYSFEAAEGDGKRPMIFSRYAGPGSHRYPVGFSGDTYATWRSLAAQPHFTATASNIGYGWWSHDIGGHMLGDRDDERLVRWIQFGVFSPIMRLHSSASPFFVKEPWKLEAPYAEIAAEFLRLRHRMLPYLYTMNYRAWKDDLPLVRPLYYAYPNEEDAYTEPNEYFFGDSLLVGAVTKPIDRTLRLAGVNMYIPKGRWIDLFTGHTYSGKKTRRFYRPIDRIPVLMKEGTILPLLTQEDACENNSAVENPVNLELLTAAGADGTFTLYEDDNATTAYMQGDCVKTAFDMNWLEEENAVTFTIHPAEGNTALIPPARKYTIRLLGAVPAAAARKGNDQKPSARPATGPEENLQDASLTKFEHKKSGQEKSLSAAISIDGVPVASSCEISCSEKEIRLALPPIPVSKEICIRLSGVARKENDWKAEILNLLSSSWGSTLEKDRLNGLLQKSPDPEAFAAGLQKMDMDEALKDAISELLPSS